jgi:SOS-response transcriptional repressor LexA
VASANSYREMFAFIDDWLEHRNKLAKLERQSGLHLQDVDEDLAEAIEEEKGEIAQLDARIASAADQVVRSAPSLLDDRLSAACRENLQYARQSFNDGDANHCCDCARAHDLLKLGEFCTSGDRAIFHLFLAEELNRGGCSDEADKLTRNVVARLPADDHQLCAAAYLAQANLCVQGGERLKLFEARHAYAETLRHLSILLSDSLGAGYLRTAKSLEVLKTAVEQRLSDIDERLASAARLPSGGPSPTRPWGTPTEKLLQPPPETPSKVIPFRSRRIPLFGKIAAGKEIVNPDDIIGYIQQTGELEFDFSGQPLEPRPLGKSRITFSQEYDYLAVQVSGDSMDRADISPGDYVIMRRTKSPTQRDIVAVVFRDEDDNRATLKRILIEPNRVTLKPESSNSKHEPRILPPEAFEGDNPQVAIVGVATAILRPLEDKGVIPSRLFPVFNEIGAGKLVPSSEDIRGYIRQVGELRFEYEGHAFGATSLIRDREVRFTSEYDYVAVCISGYSMDQAGISPNDYVILQRTKYASLKYFSGHIVAVVFREEDNKATLKRCIVDEPAGRIVLKPESSKPKYKPRTLSFEDFAVDDPLVAIVGIAIAVLKPEGQKATDVRTFPVVDEAVLGKVVASETCELAKKLFQSAGFDIKIEPGLSSFFWVKNDSPEWQDGAQIPVCCFEEHQSVAGSQVAKLGDGLKKRGSNRSIYAFIIFCERLIDGAIRKLWELRRSGLIIIPVHIAEIRRILLEPSNIPNAAYWKLVTMKRQWSSLVDPYASLNSLTNPQWFFGKQRQVVIKQILSEITSGIGCLAVFGMRRVGKTTLLNQLSRICYEQQYPVAEIVCRPWSTQYTYADLLSEIVQEWGNALEALYPNFTMPSPKLMVERYSLETASRFKTDAFKLAEAAQQVNQATKFVLILDDVDQIFPKRESLEDEYQQYCGLAQILKSVIETSSRTGIFSMVIAMEYPWIHLVDRFPYNKRFQNPLYGRFRPKPVEVLQREDWDDMVKTIGELAGLEYTSESLDMLYYKSSGHPQITRKLCSCLVELRDRAEIDSSIAVEDVRLAVSYFLGDPLKFEYLETTFWNDPLSSDLDTEQRLMQELAREEGVLENDLISGLLRHYEEFVKYNTESPPSEEDVSAEKGRLIDALRRLISLQFINLQFTDEDREHGIYSVSIPLYRDWIRQEILAVEVA